MKLLSHEAGRLGAASFKCRRCIAHIRAPCPPLPSKYRSGEIVARAAVQEPRSVPKLADLRNLRGLDLDNDEMDILSLRDVKATSYVSRRRLDAADFDPDEVDGEGLPLVYNEERIAKFWGNRPGEMASRWTKFARVSAPWLTKLANAFLQGKLQQPDQQVLLAKDAVANLENLGPTFIKLGQILSIRPDVLPPAVMSELSKLQDRIQPFSNEEAHALLQRELGQTVEEVFSEFSAQPVAAASLAQVYRARLRASGQEVAVKVQRPGAIATISKDLYVMRRAVGTYEKLVRRFSAQTTDYQSLLSTFAEGLYTEMDFRNEALNATRMAQLMEQSPLCRTRVVIPQPVMQYTTRRVLTMEWITGVRLTSLPAEEIRALVAVGQEAFLTQLLDIGFFHGDPHPGNLLKVTEGPDAGRLALLDFGLVAEIPARDREAMVSATVHLANRDWSGLMDDFVALGFLPRGADAALILPVMERVLGPYLRGGGAKAFNFQLLSQDLLAATLEIPFSVPPYMSLLARSVATLEGIALVGDPNYQMVTQAYPFVVRKLLLNESRRSTLLLRDMLLDSSTGAVRPTRMSALLNAALGYVAAQTEGFVDFDSVPEQGAPLADVIEFLLSRDAAELRGLLVAEVANGLDLLLRDRTRKAFASLSARLTPRLPFLGALPAPAAPPLLVPGVGLRSPAQVVALLAPPLELEEEVHLDTLTQLAASLMGVTAAELEEPSVSRVIALLSSPNEQLRELQALLPSLAGSTEKTQVLLELCREIVSSVAGRAAQRAGVASDELFPLLRVLGVLVSPRASQAPSQRSAPRAPHRNDAAALSVSGARGSDTGGASPSSFPTGPSATLSSEASSMMNNGSGSSSTAGRGISGGYMVGPGLSLSSSANKSIYSTSSANGSRHNNNGTSPQGVTGGDGSAGAEELASSGAAVNGATRRPAVVMRVL